MKFENKLFISVFVILVVGFSVINVISVLYIKDLLIDELKDKGKVYSKLLLYDDIVAYPDYLLITEEPKIRKDFIILDFTGKHYIMVNKDYIDNKLKVFAVSILLWEAGIITLLLIAFYYTTYKYIKRDKEMNKLLNILLMALTHRIGNFLASQKVNIELIEDSAPKIRLKTSINLLEKNYYYTVDAINSLRERFNEAVNTILVSEVLKDVLNAYSDVVDKKQLKVVLNENIYIKTNEAYLKLMFELLVENAFKYSDKEIYIRLTKIRKRTFLIIKNDIKAKSSQEGSGMGLRIAKFIAESLGFGFSIKSRDKFSVVVCM